jgi:hypothetical protein
MVSTNFDIDKDQNIECHIDEGQYSPMLGTTRSYQMYPFHFARGLQHADDPREARNRAHLRALRFAAGEERRLAGPVARFQPVPRFVFAGGSTTRSADFGPACCPA